VVTLLLVAAAACTIGVAQAPRLPNFGGGRWFSIIAAASCILFTIAYYSYAAGVGCWRPAEVLGQCMHGDFVMNALVIAIGVALAYVPATACLLGSTLELAAGRSSASDSPE
jgi:hypothetical protein